MELNERIAFVRKAAGLTQEQLGELLGVTRQAVGKWESGQSIPDAVTAARLCELLHVSADYVLLGKEPDHDGQDAKEYPKSDESSFVLPDTCPCCGRAVPRGADRCQSCEYPLCSVQDDGPERYALTASWVSFQNEEIAQELETYCRIPQEQTEERILNHAPVLLRRGLSKSAVLWVSAHLKRELFTLHIVDDVPEVDDATLALTQDALPLPDSQPVKEKPEPPLGFGGTVLAVAVGVILALVALSFL